MNGLPIHPVQKRDNYICQYCGKDGLASVDNWHDCCVDHFVPTSSGGSDDASNKVTSCGYCNQIKGNRVFKTVDEAKVFIAERRGELEKTYRQIVSALR